jgi:hypothetical protein
VIADVDATVVAWLARLVPDADIALAPPDADDSSSQRKRPTLTAFLHDVREDPDAGVSGWTSLRDDGGVVVGRQHPTRAYRFAYLLIAFGADAAREHETLGRVLTGSVLNEVVADEHLAGPLKDAEGPALIRCAPAARSVDARDLWAAWGLRPRTYLELSVCVPMPPQHIVETPAPPTRLDLGARPLAAIESSDPNESRDVAMRRPARQVREDGHVRSSGS